MNDLQKFKEDKKLEEIKISNLYFEMLKKNRERWEFADISEQLAFDKNNEDIAILAGYLSEWHEKANGDKKKLLADLWLGVLRINVYCSHFETIVKKSVSDYRNIVKENTKLVSEKKTLQLKLEKMQLDYGKEIETLRKEIEFINSNNK